MTNISSKYSCYDNKGILFTSFYALEEKYLHFRKINIQTKNQKHLGIDKNMTDKILFSAFLLCASITIPCMGSDPEFDKETNNDVYNQNLRICAYPKSFRVIVSTNTAITENNNYSNPSKRSLTQEEILKDIGYMPQQQDLLPTARNFLVG
ncbi:MAG: hypothetical protein K2X98_01180 [Alphaproteobacteria bacterium]|nr:hypothetical protein [Alphaproteobacteria bacterium]